jgi:hypothetical protein
MVLLLLLLGVESMKKANVIPFHGGVVFYICKQQQQQLLGLQFYVSLAAKCPTFYFSLIPPRFPPSCSTQCRFNFLLLEAVEETKRFLSGGCVTHRAWKVPQPLQAQVSFSDISITGTKSNKTLVPVLFEQSIFQFTYKRIILRRFSWLFFIQLYNRKLFFRVWWYCCYLSSTTMFQFSRWLSAPTRNQVTFPNGEASNIMTAFLCLHSLIYFFCYNIVVSNQMLSSSRSP